MKKVWIFDFDGTIADTLDAFYEAFRGACRQSGIGDLSTDDFLDIFEANMFTGLHDRGLGEGKDAEFLMHLKGLLAKSKDQIALFPGIGKTLNELGAKHPVYVITSNDSSIVRYVLEKCSVTAVRDVLGSDVEVRKVKKIERLKARYPDCTLYYVGDTCGDMIEAHHAGVQAVAVTWGWHSRARLQKTNPDLFLEQPSAALTA